MAPSWRTRRPGVHSYRRAFLLLAGAALAADGFQSIARLRTSSPQAYIESLAELTPPGGERKSRPLRQLHRGTGARVKGRLPVGTLPHSLYFEVHGSTNPAAPTALFLHGGPGAGCWARHACFFAPDDWRVVLFDQRGCGGSMPVDRTVASALHENTLEHLVSDCEALRAQLGVEQWALVLGGSWGTTLALAYAQAFPAAVRALLLRGMCTMRGSEVLWMFGAHGGAAQLRPDGWAAFAAAPFVTEEDKSSPDGSGVVRAYARALASGSAADAAAAASGWMAWESQVTAAGPAAGQLPEAAAGHYDLLDYAPRDSSGLAWQESAPSAQFEAEQGLLLAEFDSALRSAARAHDSAEAARTDASLAQKRSDAAAPANSNAADVSWAEAPPPTVSGGASTGAPDAAGTGAGSNEQPPAAPPPPPRVTYAQPLLTSHYCVQALDSPGGNLALPDTSGRYAGGLLNPRAIRVLRERGVRCVIVQGLRDSVCPPTTAFELKRAWPEARLALCMAAGHSMYSPPILSELVCAVEELLPGAGGEGAAGPDGATLAGAAPPPCQAPPASLGAPA